MATHMDVLFELLDRVPMVTEEQAVRYIAERMGESSVRTVRGSINSADQKNSIWREPIDFCNGDDVMAVAINKSVAQSTGAMYTPSAFWLYMSLRQFDQPCYAARYPFVLTFTRHMQRGDDRIAQIAVYDLATRKPAMVFANEVLEETQRSLRPYCGNKTGQIARDEIPGIYWRALVLLCPPEDYFDSREFQFLRGLGFTKFCVADSLVSPPVLKFSEADERVAWSKVLKIMK